MHGVPSSLRPFSVYGTFASTNLQSNTTNELGTQFTVDVPGYLAAIRRYKTPSGTNGAAMNFWNDAGALLASLVVANEPASGWVQASLVSPILVTPGRIWTVSWSCTGNGLFSYTSGDFPVDRPPLHVPSGGGVYGTPPGTFPTGTVGNDYWVDPVVLF